MNEYDRIYERPTQYGTLKWIETPRGKRYSNRDCERELQAGINRMIRWFSRSVSVLTDWKDQDMRASDIQRLRWMMDDVAAYVEVAQQELDRIEGVNRRAERIRKLRETAGRSPEEAAAYLAKAAELEATA